MCDKEWSEPSRVTPSLCTWRWGGKGAGVVNGVVFFLQRALKGRQCTF